MRAIHPTTEELAAFNNGRLPFSAQAELERHVAECSECCRVLAGLPEETLVERLRRSETPQQESTDITQGAGARETVVHAGPPKELVDHPRYRIVKQLGAGGMGVVYKAEHRMMERAVALKVIKPSILSNRLAVERFGVEVKAAARLAHPNIVAAHDADQAGKFHFLVMEFVEGASLDRVVAKNGPLSVKNAADFIRQAADGLQHAFVNGMVHRDIKPQNLMLTMKRKVKIMDFGLARLAREREPASVDGDPIVNAATQLTAMGALLGTPDYMAPEQITDSSKADIRSDIYSLGCTLYYLLAGRVPFPGRTVIEKLNSHIDREPDRLKSIRNDVPAELERIVRRMLAKDPARRFQTPAEVAKALEPFAKPGSGSGVPIDVAAADLAAPLLRELLNDEMVDSSRSTDSIDDPIATEPLSRNRARQASRFASVRWRFGPRSISVMAGVIGIALLTYWFGPRGSSDGPDRLDAQGSQSSGSIAATNAGSSSIPILADDGANSKRASNSVAASGHSVGWPGGRTPRVLIVLAARNFWYPDYEPVRTQLEQARVDVTVTASNWEALPDSNGGGDPVLVHQLLKDVKSSDYDAVIFCGGNGVGEFGTEKWSGLHARQLIHEMIAQDKLVAALCMGPFALAKAGVLAGQRAAAHPTVRDKVHDCGVEWVSDEVVVNGKIITARDDKVASQFTAALLEKLREQ